LLRFILQFPHLHASMRMRSGSLADLVSGLERRKALPLIGALKTTTSGPRLSIIEMVFSFMQLILLERVSEGGSTRGVHTQGTWVLSSGRGGLSGITGRTTLDFTRSLVIAMPQTVTWLNGELPSDLEYYF